MKIKSLSSNCKNEAVYMYILIGARANLSDIPETCYCGFELLCRGTPCCAAKAIAIA
jgi:hypothetical protein